MANKRMFSLQIVDSDAFLDMPSSSQLLYFHLAMRADDEGFIGNAKKIMRSIGGSEDDLKILIAKRFILTFKSSVIVIKHWLIHNTLRQERISPTSYTNEKALLLVKPNKSYTERQKENADIMPPIGRQNAAEIRLGIDKVSIDTEQSSGKTPPIIWDYSEKLKEMKKSEKPLDRLLAYFWVEKEFVFENGKQLSTRYTRDCKPAKKILESGYNAKHVKNAVEYIQEKYKDVDWTLETVLKVIAEANK